MKRLPKNITPLLIILISILSVFIISRLISYLAFGLYLIPIYFFPTIKGFRLHHFVYGNILITITSFLAIGLGITKHKNWFALFYGIGIGLVLDEFVLWMGDVKQLTSFVVWIPYSVTVVAITTFLIASIIMFRLYKLHRTKVFSGMR